MQARKTASDMADHVLETRLDDPVEKRLRDAEGPEEKKFLKELAGRNAQASAYSMATGFSISTVRAHALAERLRDETALVDLSGDDVCLTARGRRYVLDKRLA
jgi:hypothetical protein